MVGNGQTICLNGFWGHRLKSLLILLISLQHRNVRITESQSIMVDDSNLPAREITYTRIYSWKWQLYLSFKHKLKNLLMRTQCQL